MALTQLNAGVISDAESVTGWTGDSFSLEPDIKVEGANSVSCAQTLNGLNQLAYENGTYNLQDKIIRLYWNTAYVAYFNLTDPVRVRLGDGSNEASFIYFTQSSDYAGGWVDLVVTADASRFPGVNLSAVTKVGVDVLTGSKPRNVPANCWVDNWRFSDGAELTGTGMDFAQGAADDAAQVAGVLTDLDGIVFAIGRVQLGSPCTFTSINETLVYPDRYVATTANSLAGSGASLELDISGLVCKTVGTNKANLALGPDFQSFSLTGSSFINMSTIEIDCTNAGGTPALESTAFVDCAGSQIRGVNPTGCSFTRCNTLLLTAGSNDAVGCTFDSTTGAYAVKTTTLDRLDDCTFVSDGTGYAIDLGTISSSVSMTWNCTATGYAPTDGSTGNEVVLVNVASGQTLTINDEGAGLSVHNTGPGTVNIISGAVTVRVTATQTDGTPIAGARCLLKRVSDDSTVITGLTDAQGVIEDTAYTYVGDEAVTGWVRSSTNSPLYKQGILGGTITDVGYNATAILIRDE